MTIERARVGDVLSLERREVLVEPTADYRLVGVYSFGKGIFHREPKPGAELGNYRFFAIHAGDLVLSNIQAWEGAIALASDSDTGTIGTHRFLTYVPKDNRIDTTWARWFFLSEPGMRLIRKAAPGTTVRNRTLAIDRFEALEIPIPPLDEQQRVATRLDRMASDREILRKCRARSSDLASALPLSVLVQAKRDVPLMPTRLGDVLKLVRDPVEIDPLAQYVSMGIRSFGRGVFHYPPRPGAEIGKLRFQNVAPRLLAISNIKAWEGAIATTQEADRITVASNRFLFFRALADEDATDYFWALLLGDEGLSALRQASPGSADRNRTLALDRFNAITLNLPELNQQAVIGRRVRAARLAVSNFGAQALDASCRVEAMVPAALNEAFASFS